MAIITGNEEIKLTEEYRRLSDELMLIIVYEDIKRFLDKNFKIRFDIILINIDVLEKNELKLIDNIEMICSYAVIYGYTFNDNVSCVEMIKNGFDDFFVLPRQKDYLITKLHKRINYLDGDKEFLSCSKTGILLNKIEHEVIVNDEEIHFSKKLFIILYCLLYKRGSIVSYEELIACTNENFISDCCELACCDLERKNIRTNIRELKSKIGIDCIETVRDFGYKWRY
jgi:DNA-binding response OmpR family regulator